MDKNVAVHAVVSDLSNLISDRASSLQAQLYSHVHLQGMKVDEAARALNIDPTLATKELHLLFRSLRRYKRAD